MELKNLSENCLKCKCRTCQLAYGLDNKITCATWCEIECKGEEPLDLRPDKDCYVPIGNSILITVEEYEILKEKASMYDELSK